MPRIDFDAINECQTASEMISMFDNVRSTQATTTCLEAFVGNVANAQWREEVDKVRQAEGDVREQLKRQLPVATISALMDGGQSAKHIQEHSGLLVMDVDEKDNPDLESKREALIADPYTKALFTSAGGKGLGIVLWIEGQFHALAFEAAVAYFQNEYGLVIDTSGRDINRRRFVSYDPAAVYKESCKIFRKYSLAKSKQAELPVAEARPAVETVRSSWLLPDRPAEIRSALLAIGPDALKSRDEYIELGMGIHAERNDEEAFALWKKLSIEFGRNAKKPWNDADGRRDWNSFRDRDDGIELASLFDRAKNAGWEWTGTSSNVVTLPPLVDVATYATTEPPRSLTRVLPAARRREKMIWEEGSGFKVSNPYFCDQSAIYLNQWASAVGRFHAGLRVAVAGASESGKTTLANLVALSALDAGRPVYFYEVELSPANHLRDLWAIASQQHRSRQVNLDDVPDWDICWPPETDKNRDIQTALNSIELWAEQTPGGLLVIDYLQFMSDPSARSEHGAIEAISSRLATSAEEHGYTLLLLSQVSLGNQRQLAAAATQKGVDLSTFVIDQAKTAFAGADVRRVADVAFYVASVYDGDRPRRFIVNGKARGHGWRMEDGEQPPACMEFDFDCSGRIFGKGYGLAGVEAARPQRENADSRAEAWRNRFMDRKTQKYMSSDQVKHEISEVHGIAFVTARASWDYIKSCIVSEKWTDLELFQKSRSEIRVYKKDSDHDGQGWVAGAG